MHQLRSKLFNKNKAKSLLVVLDGVGGIPRNNKTELQVAKTKNLNKLVKLSETGCHIPIKPGLTPGSGSAHLALFGYDPMDFDIGRGVLEALGLDIKITKKDIAIRGNFATIQKNGARKIITDRRAGRISTVENNRIVTKLSKKIKSIDSVKISFKSGLDHRFVCKLSFPKNINQLQCMIKETDPQIDGEQPFEPDNLNKESAKVSKILKKLLILITKILEDEKQANFVLLRGFSTYPNIPTFKELYSIKSASLTTYPMYKGISKLVGMESLNLDSNNLLGQIKALQKNYDNYDFFYLHIKKTDSYGEDGNFNKKVKVIEDFDKCIPSILKMNFDTITITGDHSTPSMMKSHSWHPVPTLIYSKNAFSNLSKSFDEVECLKGNMQIFEAKNLLTYIFAHSNCLGKFGA